jgi:hypothetical protein
MGISKDLDCLVSILSQMEDETKILDLKIFVHSYKPLLVKACVVFHKTQILGVVEILK